MLRFNEIRDSLVDMIQVTAGLSLEVYFNRVNNSSESYIWVRMRPSVKNIGGGYAERYIRIDLQIVLLPDEFGEIRHTDLYEIEDALNIAVNYPLKIADRYVTIYDATSIIFDDILTYTFTLKFADMTGVKMSEAEATEMMRKLEIELEVQK